MIALLLLLIAGVLYVLWKQYSARPDEPPLLPGSWPIVGHTLPFLRKLDSCSFWDWLSTVAEPAYAIGGVIRVHIGPLTHYGVIDPDDMLTISNACLEKNIANEFLKPAVGEGLLTSKAPKWKSDRKLICPSFSQFVLDQYMGIFNSQSKKLVKELDKEVDQGYFDHGKYIRRNGLETIFLTALGEEFPDSSLKNKYIHAVESFSDTITVRFLKFWLRSELIYRFSALKKEQDKNLNIANGIFDSVFQKRRAEFLDNACGSRSLIPGTKFKFFLDHLVELSVEKGLMSDKDVRDHINTLISAGYDTRVIVLLLTMLVLGAHPEVQEKVFAELREVIGEEDRDVTKQDLSRLVYLEAVIKETLRIYTIVPVINRKLDKDIKLKNYTLVAGRGCFLFLHGLHRHPMWGPDRNVFRPERWLDPSQLPKNPYAFSPFSLGKRNCLGKVYALMSLKVSIAHLVRHYHIAGDESKLRFKLDTLLRPITGHFISIERRK